MDSDILFGTFLGTLFFFAFAIFAFVLLKMRYSREEFDIDPYIERVTQHLGSSWEELPKKEAPEKKEYATSIKFQINKDGSITNIEITESSGWEEMDDSIKESIEKNSPVEKMPVEYRYKNIEIEMGFHHS